MITHEYGEEEVSKNPENVVVFDFGVLDTLDKYTGSKYIDAGASREPDLEPISEINPDLIIISDRKAEVYEEIKEITPTIYLPIDFENYTESFIWIWLRDSLVEDLQSMEMMIEDIDIY